MIIKSSKFFFIFVVFLLTQNTYAFQEKISINEALSQTSSSGKRNNLVPPMVGLNNEIANTQNQNTDSYQILNRQGKLLPGESRIEKLLPVVDDTAPAPFGANIFAGGYESERIDGMNDDYLIAAGDKLSIWLWGAVNFSQVITVDNQGNLFIPNVGPINVLNVPASKVNSVVTNKIRTIYKKSVNIYVNLLTTTPVSIFISGPVIRPGQYAGMASDSVLYFLKRAGGIDADRGSYRNIKIIRDNQVIEHIDLYEFIVNGKLPKTNFKDKDVILVEPQGATVTVTGGARNSFRFEFKQNVTKGEYLIKYARPVAKISHVGVVGNRLQGPFSVYLPLEEFSQFNLKDGDKLYFNDDIQAQVYDIQISGSYLGPSYFTVSKNMKLFDVLDHVKIDTNLSDFSSIYIKRKSVAAQQKEILEQSLQRLERSVFSAPVASTGEGSIRVQEAQLVSQFINNARKIEPLGKVIVSDNGRLANIQLEQGDEIVIPAKTDLVLVGGEVLMPQSVVFNSSAKIGDYLAWAGGFTERANFDRVAVIKANGLVKFYDLADDNNEANISAGDQILVLPKIDTKTLQTVKDITQLLYQIAIAANVAIK
jgi:protein involved in polysaccharide export with SLBB domain